MERLAQLAQQQGGLGQQGAGMLPMAGSGESGSSSNSWRPSSALSLRSWRSCGERASIPGAGDMADEAAQLSRRLEAGRLDRQTVERQQRLFRRMLDAGRTLQGGRRTRRRSGRAPPPPATASIFRRRSGLDWRMRDRRLRVPTWEELQQLSPEERRLVVDYFRRLSEPSVR